MKKNIIFFVLLIKCSSIKTMDKPTYTTPDAIQNHLEKVVQLCSSTFKFLHHVSLPNPSREDSLQYSQSLLSIIEQMNCLKQAQPPITEKMIGAFIKEKPFSLSLSETASLKSPFSYTIKDSSYASLFFARLLVYNDDLYKNSSLLSPDREQIKNYFANQETQRIIDQNVQCGIIIPQEIINAQVISIPTNIAMEKFMDFIRHIQSIIKTPVTDAKKSVALIYHNELKNKK